MADLVKEFEEWTETYEGNLLEYKHEDTGITYYIDIDALRTDIVDGMYEVELSIGSKTCLAINRVCIIDGMVALETLKGTIEERLVFDQHHIAYEGVRLKNGNLQLIMGS